MVFLGLPGELQGKWFRASDAQEAELHGGV